MITLIDAGVGQIEVEADFCPTCDMVHDVDPQACTADEVLHMVVSGLIAALTSHGYVHLASWIESLATGEPDVSPEDDVFGVVKLLANRDFYFIQKQDEDNMLRLFFDHQSELNDPQVQALADVAMGLIPLEGEPWREDVEERWGTWVELVHKMIRSGL